MKQTELKSSSLKHEGALGFRVGGGEGPLEERGISSISPGSFMFQPK